MSRELKIHLKMPPGVVSGMKTLCARQSENSTMTIEAVTCKQCRNSYRNNHAWWKKLWRDHWASRPVQIKSDSHFEGITQITQLPQVSLSGFATSFRESVEKGLESLSGIRKSMGLPQLCRNCRSPILVMAFQGEEYCSEGCRKDLEAKAREAGALGSAV